MFDRDLFHNYGHAGVHFTRYVLENMERVQRRCDNLQEKIDRELQLEPKERFWSATTAANIAGGLVANECGIMDWDMDRIYLYACGLVDDLRRNGVTPVDDVRQTVADYLYRNIQNILVVNGEVDRRTHMQAAPLREPRGELLVRIEPDTKRMYFAVKPFRDYCVKRQINYKGILEAFKKTGVFLGATNKRLSKGMRIQAPAVRTLEFDTDHSDFVNVGGTLGVDDGDRDDSVQS
jgi:hypothetical protein